MRDKTTPKQLKRFIEIDEANRQRGIGVSFFIFLYMNTICDVYQDIPYKRSFTVLPDEFVPRGRGAQNLLCTRVLYFGVGVTAETIIRTASRMHIRIPRINSNTTFTSWHIALLTGHSIAKALSVICRHSIKCRWVASAHVTYAFTIFGNYDPTPTKPLNNDKQIIIAIMQTCLDVETPPQWYFEGYSY